MTQKWTLTGQIRRASDRSPVRDVVVEAWDKDVRFHSLLGQRDADANGRFSISFDEGHFGDYGGDERPDVFFKVLRGGIVLLTTEHATRTNLPPGQHSFTLDVPDAALQQHPSAEPSPPAPAAPSSEVVLHELGAAIAATLATVQRELERYPGAAGTQVVDEFDVSLPVAVRTDDLGQVLATVTSRPAADTVVGNVRVRTRPQEAHLAEPVLAPQPLDVLPQLRPADVEELRRRRVFTVDDLQRVSSTRSGLEALGHVVPTERLAPALEQSRLLSFGPLPPRVAEELVRAKVTGPDALVEQDPKKLAKTLSNRLGEDVTVDDVTTWQGQLRDLMRLDLPSKSPRVAVVRPTLEPVLEHPM